MSLEISVIIPTVNRCESLRRAILAAAEQSFPAQSYEIIIVDNGLAGDGTPGVVAECAKNRDDRSIRYIVERRLGLHHARHAGARGAKGAILVFTDDDATFDEVWLAAYARAFEAYPNMVAAGGPVRPIWEVPPPEWLRTFMEGKGRFPILSLMEPGGFRLDSREIFFGVNMAIRRAVLFDVGGFNPEAFGGTWLGDGETGLNRKLSERGWLIGHVPGAVAYHHIPAERMTLRYFRRRMINEGACDMYTRFRARVPPPWILILYAVFLAARSTLHLGRSYTRDGHTDVTSLNAHLKACRARGQVRYVLRLCVDRKLRDLVSRRRWL